MPYTGTNDWGTVDTAAPTGSDSPDVIDEAIREIKVVAVVVNGNGHNGKGVHRAAIMKATSSVAVGFLVSTNGRWNRVGLAGTQDPTSLIGLGSYTNTIKPVAGTYDVQAWMTNYQGGNFQIRISAATGNTTAPSAATTITELVGCVGQASNAAQYGVSVSHVSGQWTTDGTASLSFDEWHATATAEASGFALATPSGVSSPYAVLKLTLLGVAI